ncbi:MAG TPA: transglutaminase domain-containing protein [Chitinophagaceae bacterium]|nr:transglutaminase domain-containing protein [Chitinophagaceae bacterium]
MFRLLLVCLFWLYSVHCTAQKIRKEDYLHIDKLVQDYGPMKGSSMQYIVDSITRDCKTELQATRAFYRFQFLYLSFDLKRQQHPGKYQDNASSALMERRAGSAGCAQMFKAMCDLKKIECIVVKGVLRYRCRDIGTFDPDAIHFWNIVTINNTQYLIDPSLACGYFEERKFIREYSDAWWLTNRKLFACTHFPDDKKMQLLEVPFTKTEYAQTPLIGAAAIVAGLVPTKTIKGTMRGSEDSVTKMKFTIAGHLDILNVQASFDGAPPVPVPFDLDQFGIYLFVPNGPHGKHTLKILIKDKLAFIFRTDIRKGLKKPAARLKR